MLLFRRRHIWPKAKFNATMHDSYSCSVYGGEPFPTQRPENLYCFVSCFNPCCEESANQTQRMPDCPKECRLKPEWEKC